MFDLIQKSLTEAEKTLQAFLNNHNNLESIDKIADLISETFERDNKVIIFGNGGSMCDAMHFAEELTGHFRQNRKALPAIALSDPSFITCVANDFAFEEIFARGVEAFAQAGDIVVGISTSGNSLNVINGLQKARNLDCFTVALLGGSGGKIAGTCDFELIVPSFATDRVQEIHTMIIHILLENIENRLFAYI